jgi:protein-tyrosine phosphatase
MDISGQRARQVTAADYRRFDLILAMDDSNYDELIGLAPKSELHKVRLFLDYAPKTGTRNVPDPFYGGSEGFDHALDLIEQAARGLLEELLAAEARAAKKGA